MCIWVVLYRFDSVSLFRLCVSSYLFCLLCCIMWIVFRLYSMVCRSELVSIGFSLRILLLFRLCLFCCVCWNCLINCSRL